MIRTLLAATALVSLSACSSAPDPVPVVDAADAAAWSKYVPWNSAAENIVKTGTGMEYIVLATGPADGELPGKNATAQIHYEGRLNTAEGKVFDSSFTRNEVAEFPISLVIPGFAEALNKMRPGDSWLVFIPSKLGYGETGAGPDIPPNTDLVFEIEMKKTMTPPQSNAAAWSKNAPWNSSSPDVKKTGSGVEYVVIAEGAAGGAAPTKDQDAEVFYEGRLASGGDAFDSAFERGQTETFPVAAVVPGFSEALTLMKPGDHWLVFIPSALGYGARGAGGAIPPNADLLFEILMVGVE
jgi:FKBP-type peptidyl-prolyl cis-trans isomerase